jgi:hypothetical protein
MQGIWWFLLTLGSIVLLALLAAVVLFFRKLYFMVDEIDAKVLRIYDKLVARQPEHPKAQTYKPSAGPQ